MPHIVAIHQPAYQPWLGYLDRIRRADTFVFLDSVQFEKNSFTNRNKINTQSGPIWLTVPVKSKDHLSGTLKNLEIDCSKDWKKKHLRTIEQSYARAPYFSSRIEKVRKIYNNETTYFSDFCFDQLLEWMEILNINTQLIRSQNLNLLSSKSDLVLEICRSLDAKEYLSGPLGRDYLDLEKFAQSNIAVTFHEFKHPIYQQVHNKDSFVSHLSVLDAYFNVQDLHSIFENTTAGGQ